MKHLLSTVGLTFAACTANAPATDAAAPDAASLIPADPLAPAPACDLTAPTLATLHLRADSTRFRDAVGRTVLLRGVNAGGRSKWAPYFPFEFTDDASFARALARYVGILDAWGVDVVRLPFSWEAVEPRRGQYDEGYIARYRAVIAAFAARGIRVVVDFHQDAYASTLAGDGFPLWTLGPLAHGAPTPDGSDNAWFAQYYDPTGRVAQAFDRLWNNTDGLLDAMEAMWRTMAARVGSDAGVVGFEIINEPGWGSRDPIVFERDVLTPVIARMGNAVRDVVPDAVIFGGGTGNVSVVHRTGLGNPALPDGAFVYAPHFYDASLMLGGPYADPANDRRAVDSIASVGLAWNRPVFFGEYGADNRSPDAARFLGDMGDTLDALLASGTVWEASLSDALWNDEHLGLLHGDGTEFAGTVGLVRAYPRAIDGDVRYFAWDASARRMEIVVTGASDGVSEIELPPRVAGGATAFSIDHGCVQRDAVTGRLLVRASGSAWHLVAHSP